MLEETRKAFPPTRPCGWRCAARVARGQRRHALADPGRAGRACDTGGSLTVAGTYADVTGSLSITHDAVPANEPNDAADQRANLGATALLGPELEEPVTLTGPMQADLWATSAATDAQWVARVVDVGPDGTRVIARGWLRASHRAEEGGRGFLWHPHDAVEPLTAGEPYRLRLEVWPGSYRIPAGHRLGLLLQASDTRHVQPETQPRDNTVLVGPEHPSSVTVPLRVDAAAARPASRGRAPRRR